jgi:hypothetical protein
LLVPAGSAHSADESHQRRGMVVISMVIMLSL